MNGGEAACRMLCFCWGNPAVTANYINLLDYLRGEWNLEPLVVTDSLAGRMFFIAHGVSSLTTHEIAGLSLHPDAPRDSATLEPMTACDRFSGFNWLAPEEFESSGDTGMDFMHWQAMRLTSGFLRLIDHLRPDLALTWNGGQTGHAALAWAARQQNLPCFFVERGLMPESFVVDPAGVNFGSHIAGEGWERVNPPAPSPQEVSALRKYCEQLGRKGKSVVNQGQSLAAAEAHEFLNIPADHQVVLLPLQIEHDTNILNYSPFFKTMPEIIAGVERALAGRERVTLVVKPHPEDRHRLDELARGRSANTRFSLDLTLYSLLNITDLVVVVNSTVGLEALTQNRRVVTLGNAIYGQKSFTFDLKSREELPALLAQALDGPEDERSALEFSRFLHYLLSECLFSLDPADPFGSRPRVARRLADVPPNVKASRPDPDLGKWLEQNRSLMADLARDPGELLLVLVGASPKQAQTVEAAVPGLRAQAVDASAVVDSSLAALRARGKKYFLTCEPLRPRQRLAADLLAGADAVAGKIRTKKPGRG